MTSGRNRRERFPAADGKDLPARLRGVPVTTRRSRDEVDRTVRNIDMAQDRVRAFGFSRDGRTIDRSDLDGVNLAAALERHTARQAGPLRAPQAENAVLRAELAAVRDQGARIEERLRAPERPAPAPR